MPSLLDRVTEVNPSSWSQVEKAADQVLSVTRGLGWGHSFEIWGEGEDRSLFQVEEKIPVWKKVLLICTFPLTSVACAFALGLKWVAGKAAPDLGEKYQITVLSYPKVQKSNHVDEYHGVKVSCPYRELENDQTEGTKKWIDAQCQLTKRYLNALSSRKEMKKRLKELWNYERLGVPEKVGGLYFWTHNSGLQNQSVIYVSDSLEGSGRVLLDPNQLSDDGTTSVGGFEVSRDGQWMAYTISEAGSDWRTIRVRNVETGEDEKDEIRWAKFTSLSWKKDGSGFYYSRFKEPEEGRELHEKSEYQELYFHKLGTPQSEDRLVYSDPDHPNYFFQGEVTEDGSTLVIQASDGCRAETGILIQSLEEEDAPVRELFMNWDGEYESIHHEGSTFFFRTTQGASRGRVVKVDLSSDDPSPVEVISEQDSVIRDVQCVGGKLVVTRLVDASHQLELYNMKGEFEKTLSLPGLGMVYGLKELSGRSEFVFGFTSYSQPGTVYKYDLSTEEMKPLHSPQLSFSPEDYVTKQIFFESKDGTKVPMFVTHKKGIELDGSSPCLLYGYGGFNISLSPYFSPYRLAFMEKGGIYCVVNLRGGGEYGKEWHEAGIKLKKQNVFDDCIAAAEALIEKGYTLPEHLGVEGGSNGGLLVGAVVNQRPDLFRAALAHVGVMDMLRFNQFTEGPAWETDYGSPQNEEEFHALYAYSPLHNVSEKSDYGAVLTLTSDHDDRVVPLHSYKYVAAMQDSAKHFDPKRPRLIRIARNTGHGAGRSTKQRIQEAADCNAWLLEHLNRV